jgi:hypothetical protein
MKKTNAADLLKEKIAATEIELAATRILLKNDLHQLQESLKPINIIKNSFNKIISTPDIKGKILNSVIGLTTGIAAKKIYVGKSRNPLTKLLGFVLEMAVVGNVTKNAGVLKSVGGFIIKKIINRKRDLEKA